MTIKQEYNKSLTDNFKGLRIRKPLFYNWDKALRFDLQVGDVGTGAYFEEVIKRSTTLFKAVFKPSDKVFLIVMDYKHKRGKIRWGNFCFKQIADLRKEEVDYAKAYQLYEVNRFDMYNIGIIKLIVERINVQDILKAIAHSDFPSRHPRLDPKGVFSSKEVYFLHIDQKIIFHMYDDRGLDILASDIEALRPIYEQYNSWILDYDRNKIDQLMGEIRL